MEILSLTEAHALSEFVNDPIGHSALSKFFEEQYAYFSERCLECMLKNDVDNAKRMACFASTYETMMPVIKHFAETQFTQVRQIA
jgi:hypothetical protein